MRHMADRMLKEQWNALFRGAVALLVPELCADSLKKVEKGKV